MRVRRFEFCGVRRTVSGLGGPANGGREKRRSDDDVLNVNLSFKPETRIHFAYLYGTSVQVEEISIELANMQQHFETSRERPAAPRIEHDELFPLEDDN